MLLDAGQIFGRYTIECVLGEGGMGRVYRASDAKLLRRVALKVLNPASSRDAASAINADDLVLKEARAAAAITHENAVTIFDVGEVDGVPYIAMEYIQGESLRAFVGDSAIPMEKRIDWLAAIARALGAAHERGLIHRDVKPENVIVRDDGFIKVLDFGIAQHRSTIASVSKLEAAVLAETVPGGVGALSLSSDTRISGTPAYMAPEQFRGERSDGRADQFAWGLVAYELLTGQHACPDTTLTAIIAAILGRIPPAPRMIEPLIPDHVDRVVMRALMKDPRDRFPSMIDLLSALTLADARASAPRSTPSSSSSTALPSRPPSVERSVLESARTESASVVVMAKDSAGPNRRRQLLIVLGVTAVALGAVGLIAKARSSSTSPSTASASASARAIAVTDLPIPPTTVPEAGVEYRAGLQSARDGAGSEARVHFARAVELDPALASAHVWLASMSAFQNRAQARAALERANAQRAILTERDARFLASIAPLLDRDPADLAAATQLAIEAAALFPTDAHLRLHVGILRSARGDPAALTDVAEALRLDPKYVAAHLIRALTFESLGKEEDALVTYEKCVTDNPASASCFAGELKLLSRKGQCDRVNDEARRWTTSHPSDPEAFRQRAIFLSAKSGSNDNVAELLSTSRSLVPAGARPRRERIDALMTDLLGGDLVHAKESANKLAREATDIAEHGEAALALVEINEELNHADEADRVAFDFFKRHELWAGAARMDQDPTAFFAFKARRSNLVSVADANKARDAWLERWATRGRSGERWLLAYASSVETADDAKLALEALPRFAPLPTLPDGRLAAALGRSYLLAGHDRLNDAIATLESAASDCGVLRMPIMHARSLLWLGDAFALRGLPDDKAKACDAYKRVGVTKSVTSSLASAAMTKLACAR